MENAKSVWITITSLRNCLFHIARDLKEMSSKNCLVNKSIFYKYFQCMGWRLYILSLNNEIKKLAKQFGITYFGVANLSVAYDAVLEQGGDIVSRYPYSVSLGIPLLKEIVDQLPNRHQRAVALNYRHHAYIIPLIKFVFYANFYIIN
jgi:hypothetical protein